MAGLIKSVHGGLDLRGQTVACIITGSGLKDPDLAIQQADAPMKESPADLEAVIELLNLRAPTGGRE